VRLGLGLAMTRIPFVRYVGPENHGWWVNARASAVLIGKTIQTVTMSYSGFATGATFLLHVDRTSPR